MLTKIQKWGNSQGVRISKDILKKVLLKENDFVEIIPQDGYILIKSNKQKHIPLKERIKNYNGNYDVSEWDISENIGKEVF
jgi:antitoxin MazE